MSGRSARQTRKRQAGSARSGWITERRVAYVAAAIAIVTVVIGGVAIANKKGSASSQPISASADSVIRVSGRVPSIAGTDPITGRQVSLTQFNGKPVVLNVWASWCPGCNQEAADLARVAARHPEVLVLGVDMQDTTGGARAFYRKWRWRHPSIADPSGSVAAQLAVTGLPTTLFLDARHRLVGEIVGAGSLAAFEQGVRLALSAAGR
jgi:thiol-disulfide isomerase/thioredoxin